MSHNPHFHPSPKKVSIIGCGKVGMTTAYTLVVQGIVDELVLIGHDKDETIGEQMDLEHGMSFLNDTEISATDSYENLKDSAVVVVTAGIAQKPGQTRLDLVQTNLEILETIIPQVVAHAPQAVILIVSNPVDILTYKAYQLAGLPKGRVFGTGTALDTARFRHYLSEQLHISAQSIHAYILGEHGESSFPAVTSATIGGQPITTFPEFHDEDVQNAFEKTKAAAGVIIKRKGATFYAISAVVAHIVNQILSDSKSVLPVSVPLHRFFGESGVALSVPCIIGKDGVEQQLEIKLSWEEKQAFAHSAQILREYM